MDKLKNIVAVVEDGLCLGCGTCAAACPTEAILMKVSNGLFLPVVEEDKCTSCGLCVKVCPGHSVDFSGLNAEAFYKQPDDLFLGSYIRCYLAHSNGYDVRFGCASGGLITQLLILALEKGMIDGVLVVRMKRDKPLVPEPFIARTKEEIIAASKSKYCPVSVNEGLKRVLREDGRFAVVGLPCHIHGVRKAEKELGALRGKIAFRIGLFCSHTVSFTGTDFLLRKLGVKKGEVARINYRGMGWPGSLSIRLKDGSNLLLPYVGAWNSYWPVFSSFFFTPVRCLMCPDETNELADISCGDAWLPEFKSEKVGESVVMVRSRAGEEILNQADSTGVISLKPINPEKVQFSQAEPLRFKKDDFEVRLALLKSSGSNIPVFKGEMGTSHSFLSWVRNLFALLNVSFSENRFLERFLVGVPFPLFRLYYGVYKLLSLA